MEKTDVTLSAFPLPLLLAAALPCLVPAMVSADHLHYYPVDDLDYTPFISDYYPDDPLYEWVIIGGSVSTSVTIKTGPTVTIDIPDGAAISAPIVAFDAPAFAEVKNPRATVFFEFEISELCDTAVASIEMGFTDLVNDVKWDDRSRTIRGDRHGSAPVTMDVFRSSYYGQAPFRVQFYYNFASSAFTVVFTGENGPSPPFSWQSNIDAFENFFGLIDGTDPDNLDIYPYLTCQVDCAVTVLDRRILDCDVIDGGVDIESCGADLAITVDDGQATVNAGQTLSYQITASNFGPSPASSVSVTDHFPEGLTCTWICAGSGGAACTVGPVAGDIVDSARLPAGSAATYFATCTLDLATTGLLTNTASISGAFDLTLDNNSATDEDLIVHSADLGIAVNDGQTSAVPGGSVSYVLTAINFGPSDVIGATVSDPFPPSLDCDWICWASGGASCAALGSGAIDETVDLPAGATASFLATCTIASGATGALENGATISPPNDIEDSFAGNDSAADADELTPLADLVITADDGATTAVPGEQITYTILVSNPSGPSDAPGSAVTDAFPAVLGDCSWTCTGAGGGSCTASGVGDIADLANLPVGASATYTATCTIDPGASGVVSNTANIASAGGVTELSASDNSSTDVDTLEPEADLRITKTNGVGDSLPGQDVTYTLVAANTGPSNVLAAKVEDILPAELIGCNWTCSPDSGAWCTEGEIPGDLVDSVDLPTGSQATYTGHCTVDPAAVFESFSNTVTITAPVGVTETNSANNTAADTDLHTGLVVIFRDGFEGGDATSWSARRP